MLFPERWEIYYVLGTCDVDVLPVIYSLMES